jgi:hypothetical protein
VPTVLRAGPYRFGFYALDRDEPRHVHVWRDNGEAKFWLDPVRYDGSRHFNERELRRIERLVREYAASIREQWDEYFSG